MQIQEVQEVLKSRFETHMERHSNISWPEVCTHIDDKDWEILSKMEASGGEPDVLVTAEGKLFFVDCCKETPEIRRSVCYDEEARFSRKKNAPRASAWGMADTIGAPLLDEKIYRTLQGTGEYDLKGQVWLATDEEFREKGDALFANLRHGRVFVYYNGVGSYYRNRGFRCMLALD